MEFKKICDDRNRKSLEGPQFLHSFWAFCQDLELQVALTVKKKPVLGPFFCTFIFLCVIDLFIFLSSLLRDHSSITWVQLLLTNIDTNMVIEYKIKGIIDALDHTYLQSQLGEKKFPSILSNILSLFCPLKAM